MSINTQWFRDKLADKQLSQRGLARLMDLDSSAVSLMLRGKREIKLAEAAAMARLLGATAEEVLVNAGANVPKASDRVPVLGTMAGDGHIIWQPAPVLGTVPRPAPELPEGTRAVQCRSAGSDLDYMEKWVFYIPEPRNTVEPESLERLSVVKPKGGAARIAQVRRGYQPHRWNLSGPAGSATDVELEYAVPILLITT